jgi:hypothetical protein
MEMGNKSNFMIRRLPVLVMQRYSTMYVINILPLIEGVMVDYHTKKTNIIRVEVEGDIVVF